MTGSQLKIWNPILDPREFWESRIKSLVLRIEMRVTVNLLLTGTVFHYFFHNCIVFEIKVTFPKSFLR